MPAGVDPIDPWADARFPIPAVRDWRWHTVSWGVMSATRALCRAMLLLNSSQLVVHHPEVWLDRSENLQAAAPG